MLAVFGFFFLNSKYSKLLCLKRTFPDHNSLSFSQLNVLTGGKLREKLCLMFNYSNYVSPKEELISSDDNDDDDDDDGDDDDDAKDDRLR